MARPRPAERQEENALSFPLDISVTMARPAVNRTHVMNCTLEDIVDFVAQMRRAGVEAFRWGELEVSFRADAPATESLFRSLSFPGERIDLEAPPEDGGKPATSDISDDDLFYSSR